MTITIIGIALASILFLCIVYSTVKVRKEAYISMLYEKSCVPVACAGSDENSLAAATKEIQAIGTNAFKDEKGRYLNPSDFKHFIVHGKSMQFCGINNNDLIFVDSNFSTSLKDCFPCVLVLRRVHAENTSPQYKIRRTWLYIMYASSSSLVKEVKALMASHPFQQIRQLDVYDGDDCLMTDLVNFRIPAYEKNYIDREDKNDFDRNLIISTTFHTKENKIRFSIHPVSLIEGRVIASFHL